MQKKLNNVLQKIQWLLGNQFFLSGGQVLGAVREKKFLKNEHDIDLGIFAKDVKKIVEILEDEDLLDKNSIRKIERTNIIRCIKFKLDGIDIDIFVYHLMRGKYYGITKDKNYGYAFHKFPKYIFDDLDSVEFMGGTYKVPDLHYLQCEYGKDWQTPIKKWNCCLNPSNLDKKVYLGGIFDLFHVGHLNLLKEAQKLGGILFVSILTDEVAEKYKRKPVIPYEQRIKIVKEFADIVMPQNDVDEVKDGLMDLIKPDIIVHGDDALPHSYNWAIMNEKKTIQFPYTKQISTTQIIERIKNG